MRRPAPRFKLHDDTLIHARLPGSEVWQTFRIVKKTANSVFLDTPDGSVQLDRVCLERTGQTKRLGRLFCLIHLETMTKGYAASTRDLDAERTAKLAREFRPSPRMEHLLVLRNRDPDAYARMGSTVQISVGHYELGRTAAGYTPEGDDHGDTAA